MDKINNKYTCNICLKEVDKLSFDHVPPKCCGNNNKIKFRKVYFDDEKRKEFISQNGMKFKTICNDCNNKLGFNYDKALKEFMDFVIKKIENGEVNFKYSYDKIKVLLKGIIGHMIATTAYEDTSNSVLDKSLRDFYLNDKKPEEYELFLYIYPYTDIIFTAKNIYPINFSNKIYAKKIPKCGVTVLYFFPFAFIYAEKGAFDGVKLFEFMDNTEIKFSSNSLWVNKKINRLLPPFWPLQVDSNIIDGVDSVIGGIDSRAAIIAESGVGK